MYYQTNIYEYLSLDKDPLYKMLYNLNKGDFATQGHLTINYNYFGLYEAKTVDSERSFTAFNDCYQYVNVS